jgi:hypothetical protein
VMPAYKLTDQQEVQLSPLRRVLWQIPVEPVG